MSAQSTAEFYRSGHLTQEEYGKVRDAGIWDILHAQVAKKLGCSAMGLLRVMSVRQADRPETDERGNAQWSRYLEVGVRIPHPKKTHISELYYLRMDSNNGWGMPEGDPNGEPLRSILGDMAMLYDRPSDMTPHDSETSPLLTSPPLEALPQELGDENIIAAIQQELAEAEVPVTQIAAAA